MKIGTFGILSAVLLGTLALPATPRLLAQSSSASGATSSPAQVVDQILSMVEHEMVSLAESMPADKYDFAPTQGNFQGVRTFSQQIKHVIGANYGMFGAAASMPPTGMPKMDTLKTKDQIVAALKASFAFAHSAVATLDQQNALEEIKPVDGVKTRAGIMIFAIVHMNDHLGQMVEYLRMNGIAPSYSMPAPKK
jgi:uncharacterized damage-inducible protein DinB